MIQKIFDSRLGPASKRARAPEAEGRKFKFWFSTQKDGKTKESDTHMAEVQKLTGGYRQAEQQRSELERRLREHYAGGPELP